MLRPSGAERWVITRHEPFCFGTTPKPEQWKGEKGGCGKVASRSHAFSGEEKAWCAVYTPLVLLEC